MMARRYMTDFLKIILHTSNRISPQVMSNIINCRKCCCVRLFLISNLTGWLYKYAGTHSHQKTFLAHDVCFFFTFSSPLLSLYFVSSFSQCQHSKAVFVLLCCAHLVETCGWLQLNHNSIPPGVSQQTAWTSSSPRAAA